MLTIKPNQVTIKVGSQMVEIHKKTQRRFLIYKYAEQKRQYRFAIYRFQECVQYYRQKKTLQILKEKEILEENEVIFRKDFHKNVYYSDPINKQEKYWFKNCVVQGSPISPPLFNIYLDEFVKNVQLGCQQFDINYIAYADDLFILDELLVKLVQIGIFKLKNKNPQLFIEKIILQSNNLKFQVILLSTNIAIQGLIYKIMVRFRNIQAIQQRELKKLVNKLKWICCEMQIQHKISIWQLFINSLLNYTESAINLNLYNFVRYAYKKNEIIESLIYAKSKNQIPNNIGSLFGNQWKICPTLNEIANFEHLATDHIKISPKELIELITSQ